MSLSIAFEVLEKLSEDALQLRHAEICIATRKGEGNSGMNKERQTIEQILKQRKQPRKPQRLEATI